MRPRRDPEPTSADDRPSRRAARPVVRQDTHGRTLAPLGARARIFGGLPAVDGWRQDGAAAYVVVVSDAKVAAPAITRALVAGGADVLSIGESHHSLEDVYLELIDDDHEARGR